eukprot:jgi/Bigna1/147227/aug1.133_g21935
MVDQGNSIGSQDVTRDHVEGAEGKETKLEKSEVWTGGDGLREGVPVAQPVASERSHKLGTGARHSLTVEDVLEQFGNLDVHDGRRVAKSVLHCDGVDENVDNLVKVTTNDLESREFALHRCMDKGATLRTWACTLEKSRDPDCAPPGMLETKERKAKQQPFVRDVAGAVDSFRRHCPIKGKLCVATVSPPQFRRKARGLCNEIEARAASVGQTDLGFGCECFQTCLSSHVLERLRREAARNRHDSETPEGQFEMALEHPCDEEDKDKLQRDFEDELDFLRRKRCRCVDAMHRQFGELVLEFAGPRFGHANKLRPHDVDELVECLRPLEESCCDFEAHPLHSNASTVTGPAVQRECVHFKRGKCNHGDKCKLLHVKQNTSSEQKTKKCTQEQLDGMKNQDCGLCLKGKCHRGDKCKFRHGAGSLEAAGGVPVGLPSHTCEESADAPRQNVEASLLQINSQSLPELIKESEQRHCERDPSLRSRKKVECFLQADDGAVAVLGLVDDGAQPTAISEALHQKSKSAGVKFAHRPMVGEAGGSSSSIENKTLREVDFTVQMKKREKHGARVELRTCALVPLGPVSQDFALGIGALDTNGINFVEDPDPAKRVATINGEIVDSHPCSVDVTSATVATVVGMDVPPMAAAAPGEICGMDASLAGELPGVEEVSSVVRKELADAVDRGFVSDRDHVIKAQGLPDIDIESMANPIQSGGVLLQRLSSIAPLSEFGDQRAVANSDLVSGHVLDMLDRLEREMVAKESLLPGSQQFHCLRTVVCRFRKHFVTKLPEVGKHELREPHDVERWLKPDCKPVRQRPCHLEPNKLKLVKLKLDQVASDGSCCKATSNTSEWASPAFCVRDEGKALPRVVVAMGRSSELVELVHAVCPVTRDAARKSMNAQWAMVSDSKAAWRQLGVTECTKSVFALVTPLASFASEGLPMGCKNAPQVWVEEVATRFLVGAPGAVIHFDDFFTLGQSPVQALAGFAKLVQQCEKHDNHQSATKSHVFPERLAAAGSIKEARTHCPDPKRAVAVDKPERPTKGRRFSKHVRRLAGLFTHCLECTKGFWQVTAPIKQLLMQGAEQAWKEEHDESLAAPKDVLKKAVSHVPGHKAVSTNQPFILGADASDVAGGAALSQVIGGSERLLACCSFAWKTNE